MAVNLRRFCTFGIAAQASSMFVLKRQMDLSTLADRWHEGEPLYLLGKGTNSIFLNDVRATIVLVRLSGNTLTSMSKGMVRLRACAGESWSRLAWKSVEQGLWGLENLVDIPSSVGAAPIQNIGAYGRELSDLIVAVEYYSLSERKKCRLTADECAFGYRDSIFKLWKPGSFVITAIELQLTQHPNPCLEYTDLKPLRYKNSKTLHPKDIADSVRKLRATKLPDLKTVGHVGSFFKNPIITTDTLTTLQRKCPKLPAFQWHDGHVKIPAAWLIEDAGLKGFRIGAIGVSQRHALVLEHYFNRQSSQPQHVHDTMKALSQVINHVQRTIQQKYGVMIEPEPTIYSACA